VLVPQSCIGNRSLGWEPVFASQAKRGLRGPEETDSKREETKKTFRLRWLLGLRGQGGKKGTEPERITWYAGMQYDGDIANAKRWLCELGKKKKKKKNPPQTLS